jgi:guanine deaminase
MDSKGIEAAMPAPPSGERVVTGGRLWRLRADPWSSAEPDGGDDQALESIDHGGLVIGADGRIVAVGRAADLTRERPWAERVDFGDDSLILPGFVDAHLHALQLDMIGCHGESLLGWLRRYTFPTEARLADPARAADVARRLATELLANGVTTAAIYGPGRRDATEALLQALLAAGLRAFVGKVSMDRNAPEALLADPEADALDIEALIAAWHGRDGRIRITLAPRFAPACSEAMLAVQGELRRRHPELLLQTHLAETPDEAAWVRELFPEDRDCLAVYERHGLVDGRALMGHCVHLSAGATRRLADSGAVAVHCPTSNLFLGSGLAPVAALAEAGCRLALGSDVGAGTSLSPWRTLAAAYQVARLRGRPVAPTRLYALATLGGADALGLAGTAGNLAAGMFADFVVLDWRRNRLLAERFARDEPPGDLLAALFQLADDRLTRAVFIGGLQAGDS